MPHMVVPAMRSRRLSREKRRALDAFAAHVSPAKAEFFRRLGMDFVLGRRAGPWLEDLDGRTRLYDLHGNGGVFNLGGTEDLNAMFEFELSGLARMPLPEESPLVQNRFAFE